jgi:hypothetical protein
MKNRRKQALSFGTASGAFGLSRGRRDPGDDQDDKFHLVPPRRCSLLNFAREVPIRFGSVSSEPETPNRAKQLSKKSA